MKQNASAIAVLMMVLAFFGITSLPKSSPESVGGGPKPKSKTASQLGSKAQRVLYKACDEIKSRLQPFVSDHGLGDGRLPESCYEDHVDLNVESGGASFGVQFAIATVSDPISTHLPLLFDRSIEIIQQAAQDDGYSYDSSWFPWDEFPTDSLSVADQLTAEEAQDKQREQPGIVAFRRSLTDKQAPSPYTQGLVVFVVAEQPTGGINTKEFRNALLWMERLGVLTPGRFRGILGPTFSGSIPSLAHMLTAPQLKAFNSKGSLLISSGSVSSKEGYEWFNTYLDDLHLGSFQTATEEDSLMIDRFCQYVTSQHYYTNRIAVLSEDETAFGAIATPESATTTGSSISHPDSSLCETSEANKEWDSEKRQGPIYLYYPRDIATLRSAYEQQSIFRRKTDSSSASTPPTTLRGDLSEPASSDHDTVRSYSGQLTPLAQESVLQSITNILRDKHIEFIVLRSTNSLDQIFLSQFFRRAYPEARIVIDGADLLFLRGAEGTSLRGVTVLSTYPLLTWQQDWTSLLLAKSNPSVHGEGYRIFEEDVGEGLYIAARQLFRDQASSGSVPISDYAPPAWALGAANDKDNQRPATWLSVIGNHQFWPVAVLNAHTLDKSPDRTILLTSSARGITQEPAAGDNDPLRLPIEFVVLLIVCIAWSFLHLLWCSRGSISPVPSPFRLAYFAPLLRSEHSALIAFGSLLPMVAATAVTAASGLLSLSLGAWRGGILVVWTVAVIGFSCLACLNNYRLSPLAAIRKDGCPYPAQWQRRATIIATVILTAFVLVRVMLLCFLFVANRIPTYWRSVHVLSGVSPLTPQLLVIAGLYLWFWYSLRGLALFGKDRPLLPKACDLSAFPDPDRKQLMPMFSRQVAQYPVEAIALPWGRHYQRIAWIAIPFTVAIFAVLLQGFSLRTLGEKQFGLIMFLWFSLCMALILADTTQLWLTWKELRPVLTYLDRLPLRRTLSALKGISWGSIWALSTNSLEERYRIVSRQFESMRHLDNCLNASKPEDKLPVTNKNDVLNKISDCHAQGIKLANWYASFYSSVESAPREGMEPLRRFQEELASTAGLVMTNLLVPAWQHETKSLIFFGNSSSEKKDAAGDNEASVISVPTDVPPYVSAAEEFFLLPYLGFIQNILGRVRTIVLGSLFLFVSLTLAVSSYPFDPLPVLGGMFLIVFAITGATVIWVYAEMHRDATLSYITNTRPGELGGRFWLQLGTFGIAPLLGLLTTLFPSVTDFISSWILPGYQTLK